MHAALAIAPAIIGNTVPQIAIHTSVRGDGTFGQMLRSAHEADGAVTSLSVPNNPAMMIPERLEERRVSGSPMELPALLSNSSQGTKPARVQRAVGLADGTHDGIVEPAAAIASASGEAAAGAGAFFVAPLNPLPEAVPGMPGVRPRAIVVSGAPATGAAALASPAEGAGLPAAGDSVASPGAAPEGDAETALSPKINPLSPGASASSASATTPEVAESASGAFVNILPRPAQSSHDVGMAVGQRSASSSSTAPRSTIGIPAASMTAAHTSNLLAAVVPTAVDRRTGPSTTAAPPSDDKGASGSIAADVGLPKVFAARVDGKVPTRVPVRAVDGEKSAAVPAAANGLSADRPPLATAAVPLLTPVSVEAPAAIPATAVLGEAVATAPAPVDGEAAPAANAERDGPEGEVRAAALAPAEVGNGIPAPAGENNGMIAALSASSGVTNPMRAAAAVTALVSTSDGAPAAVPAFSVVGNRAVGVSARSDIDVPAAEQAPATTALPPAPPAPTEGDVGAPASVVVAEGMRALPPPAAAGIGIEASGLNIEMPAPVPAHSMANIEMPAPTPALSIANMGVSPMPALSASSIGMLPPSAPSISDIEAIAPPSTVVDRMPDAVAVPAAVGNELPATPPASGLAMVATELPAATPDIEPSSMRRQPVPRFVGPSGAAELTVAGLDRNRPPMALPGTELA